MKRTAQPHKADIAVIGYAGKFPGAQNVDEFWDNLAKGVDSVTEVPVSRWNNALYYHEQPGKPFTTYCGKGGFVDGIDRFDNAFFNISDDEAMLMDPRQRLLLETTYSALEQAGYGGKKLNGSLTGVFIGSSYNYYDREMPLRRVLSPYGIIGVSSPLLANRISHLMNFQGPSYFIDTFCSSSLNAVHLACRSLLDGECTTAVAGGVHVLSFLHYVGLSQFRTLSPDGKCKSFDARADGFVPGEGAGVVVLKPVADALRDSDEIHAVIKGGLANHTGRANSITSPNPAAQEQLIAQAYARADIDCETITYVEAHGTGTELGDPLEFRALKTAFRRTTKKKGFCALGSVKTNIGHLEPAAGITGLIKIILSLKHKKIPGILHLRQLNRFVDLDESPFYINDKTIPWNNGDGPRRAAISAFGLSGSNIHMIIEEAPERKHDAGRTRSGSWNVLPLSAKTPRALQLLIRAYSDFLVRNRKVNIHDLCYTASTGRGAYAYRAAVGGRTKNELLRKLSLLGANGKEATNDPNVGTPGKTRTSRILFAVSGDMEPLHGEGSLLAQQPAFSRIMQVRAQTAKTTAGKRSKIGKDRGGRNDGAERRLLSLAQSIGVANMLMSWGVRPDAVFGYGRGEIAAACLSGVLAVEDGLAAASGQENQGDFLADRSKKIRPVFGLVSVNSVIPREQTFNPRTYFAPKRDAGRIRTVFGTIIREGYDLIVHIGKRPTPWPPAGSDGATAYISIPTATNAAVRELARCLMTAYVYGADIDWETFNRMYEKKRIMLPTYPFEHKSHWFPQDEHNSMQQRMASLSAGEPEFTSFETLHESTPDNNDITAGGVVSADTQRIEEEIYDIIGRKTGLAADVLGQSADLESAGIDSITKVEIASEMINRRPGLSRIGDLLTAARTVGEMIALVVRTVDVKDTAARTDCVTNTGRGIDLDSLYRAQKRNAENLVCESPRLRSGKPGGITAHLVVDERHPFFFDHPLDHVSGVHLIEAMLQIVHTAYCQAHNLAVHPPLFISHINVDFSRLCEKGKAIDVESEQLDYREAGSTASLFKGTIRENDTILCAGDFRVQPVEAGSEFGRTCFASLQRETRPRSSACDAFIVNKRTASNVFICDPVEHNDSQNGLLFDIMPVGDHSLFGDSSGSHVPSLYLLEAFRQTQRYLDHTKKENAAPQASRAFLASLGLRLERPIGRHELTQIKMGPISHIRVGKSMLAESTGYLLVDGVERGVCTAKSILVTDDPVISERESAPTMQAQGPSAMHKQLR